MSGGLSVERLAQRANLPVRRTALILIEFERQGLAERDEAGLWTLTPSGRPFGVAAGALAPFDHDGFGLTYREQHGTGLA